MLTTLRGGDIGSGGTPTVRREPGRGAGSGILGQALGDLARTTAPRDRLGRGGGGRGQGEEESARSASSRPIGEGGSRRRSARSLRPGVRGGTGWELGQAWLKSAARARTRVQPGLARGRVGARAASGALKRGAVIQPEIGLPRGQGRAQGQPGLETLHAAPALLRGPVRRRVAGLPPPLPRRWWPGEEVVAVLRVLRSPSETQDEVLIGLMSALGAQLGSLPRESSAEQRPHVSEQHFAAVVAQGRGRDRTSIGSERQGHLLPTRRPSGASATPVEEIVDCRSRQSCRTSAGEGEEASLEKLAGNNCWSSPDTTQGRIRRRVHGRVGLLGAGPRWADLP